MQEDKATGAAHVQVPARADLRQRRPRRRDQPHAAQDAGRPARGDAGAPGHRRRRRGTGCPTRSSCWRRRTRSSRKAPTRCPRPSSTASCSTSSSTTPRRRRSSRSSELTTATHAAAASSRCCPATDILELQEIVRKVPVADHVIRYAMQLRAADAARTRREVPDFVRDYVTWGAGPRASQYLILAAKARAVLHGRYYVSTRGRPRRGRPGAAAPHHHQLQRRGRGHQARRHRRSG